MRVLWLCNIVLPRFAKELNEPIRNNGGWLTGIFGALEKEPEVELAVVFPASKNIDKVIDGIRCFGFIYPSEELFEEYLEAFCPDVVHVFGTEYYHSNCMMRAAQKTALIDHTVVSIQGLVHVYAKHFTGFMEHKHVKAISLKELVSGNALRQQKQFNKRGDFEKETLRLAKHIIGRTDWDKACVERLNKNAKYHFCNESLRPSFYEKIGAWDYEKCEKHSIFVSQCGYPIKGFHLMLEALADIVKVYPDCKVYTTGKDLIHPSLREKLVESSYHKYLRKLIIREKLVDHVVFLGNLDEEKMRNQFLKSNIFVSCSSIENSPNSLGEAMLLGVPCVSSDVGGVKNMLIDRMDGYTYPADEPYMCAYYVMKLFSDEERQVNFSNKASAHAKVTHNVEINNNQLLSIYNLIK